MSSNTSLPSSVADTPDSRPSNIAVAGSSSGRSALGSGSSSGTGSAAVVAVASGGSEGDDEEEEYFDTEPLPILGRCKALYPFEGEIRYKIRFNHGLHLLTNRDIS